MKYYINKRYIKKSAFIARNCNKKKEINVNPILTNETKNKNNISLAEINIITLKAKNKKIKNIKQIPSKNVSYYLFLFTILYIYISNIHLIKSSTNSYITMKVPQGEHKIYTDGTEPDCSIYFSHPSEVLINGENQIPINNTYIFPLTINNVTLVWNTTVTNCHCLFYECDHILEMNLTYFNTSKVTTMYKMFQSCKLLTSIDLTNIDTSNVDSMGIMFGDCYSLISLDVSKFNTSKVWNMGTMFQNCRSLKEIDVSNFDTSNAKYIDRLFNGCLNLTSVDLSSFDTSNVFNMEKMFQDCILLTSINISNFDTHNVDNVNNMFNGCKSLISLEFPNINLTKVNNLNNIFSNCNNLQYIDIKNYIKSETNVNRYFFSDSPKNLVVCVENNELKNIIENHGCNVVDCSDDWFKYKKKLTEGNECVNECNETEYQYEYNFKCIQSCLNGTYIDNYKCLDCHPDCKECTGPYDNNCIICSSPYKYLKFGKCVNIEECSRGFYINETTGQNTCKCDLEQCDVCSLESLNKNLCITCEKDYYPIYDNNYDIYYPLFNCTKSPEGYYLDNDYIYKLCYLSCKTCDSSGNEEEHNCKECKYGFNFEIKFELYKNCYDNCSFYHYYVESESIIYCTKSEECPNDYSKLIEDKKECVSTCSKGDNYKYEFRNYCYKECPSNSIERKNSNELYKYNIDSKYYCKPLCSEENPFEIILAQECAKDCDFKNLIDKYCLLDYESIKETEDKDEKKRKFKAYNILINDVEESITSDNYNTTNIEEGKDDVFEYENMTITLTTTETQKKEGKKSNKTTIDLLDCERLLREAYNISEDDYLFMEIIEIPQEGMHIPKVLYEVYSRLKNSSNLVKLNLSHCANTKIDIIFPAILTDSIDMHNSSSGYYNDICYTANSESGTDIILKDRQKEFEDKNRTICQENCLFSEYDFDTQKAKCSCDVEDLSPSFDNIKIDTSKIFENFINIKNIVNVNLFVCNKVLFSKKGLSKNYGFFSLLLLIIIHFIILILFYGKKLYKKLEEKIKDISFGIKNWDLIKKEEIEEIKDVIRIDKKKNKTEIINKTKKEELIHIKENKNRNKNKEVISYNKNRNKKQQKKNPPIKRAKKNKNQTLNPVSVSRILKISNNFNNIENKTKDKLKIKQNYNMNIEPKTNSVMNQTELDKAKKIMEYNNEELNDLKYNLALKNDTRNYCQYYISLLKIKHIIIFTFFNNTDYNSKIIKIDLLIFNFVLYFAVNTLFFSDSTMHKIYVDKGAFDFIYHFPQIIYSSLISVAINILLKMLALSEKLILKFKSQKEKNNLKGRISKLNRTLKIKFLVYFILSSIFLLFFWYYISMFCSIYVNTQMHLIKDTLISFFLSMTYPFGICLLPGIFRIPALSHPKNKRYYLYTVSIIIQFI